MDFNFSQIDLKQEAGGREKIYFAVILLLIVVSFARWFYVPKMKQIKMMQIEIKNNVMQVDTLKQFAQLKIPEPAAKKQEAVKSGTRFEKAVAASMKSQQQVVADIVKMLTANKVLSGVSLTGMSFAAEVNKGAYSAIPVGIELMGKYSDILNYLGQVEKFGKLVTVDNVELSVSDKASSVIHGKIIASIYIVNPSPASPPPNQQQAQTAGQQPAASKP